MEVETGGNVKDIFLAKNCVYIYEWWKRRRRRWNKYNTTAEWKQNNREKKKWHEIFMFMTGLCIEMVIILLCAAHTTALADPILVRGHAKYIRQCNTLSHSVSHLTWIIKPTCWGCGRCRLPVPLLLRLLLLLFVTNLCAIFPAFIIFAFAHFENVCE